MIHGDGCVTFSMADLNTPKSYLYGVYKFRKEKFECELLQEYPDDGTTEVRTKSGEIITVKTNRLHDLQHSNEPIW